MGSGVAPMSSGSVGQVDAPVARGAAPRCGGTWRPAHRGGKVLRWAGVATAEIEAVRWCLSEVETGQGANKLSRASLI
jgi:hypothetical protein